MAWSVTYTDDVTLQAVRELAQNGRDAEALTALHALRPLPNELAGAAALALHLGQPARALGWWQEAEKQSIGRDRDACLLGQASAALRLGRFDDALGTLAEAPKTARTAVLRGRALAMSGNVEAPAAALAARAAARAEGDAPALVAAVTLLGELEHAARPEHKGAFAALRTLAEGLKVAELTGEHADPHLLAVLAHVQRDVGSAAKGQATAGKALERASRRSPARVLALLALNRASDAAEETAGGQLRALAVPGFLRTDT